jgi:hypothetical protein
MSYDNTFLSYCNMSRDSETIGNSGTRIIRTNEAAVKVGSEYPISKKIGLIMTIGIIVAT